MPICIPAHPVFKSDAERTVWDILKRDLPDRAFVISNLPMSHRGDDFEVDFVVVWPGIGVCNLEVKGGYVQRRGVEDWTTTNRHGGSDRIDPNGQLRRNHYAIKEYVDTHWSLKETAKLAGLAVFPDTAFPADFDPPDLRADRIVDRDELQNLVERIRKVCYETLHQVASADYCFAFVNALTATRDATRDFVSMKDERAAIIRRWTAEQKIILDVAKSMPCFAVTGPAGSGKTYLALEQTHRLTKQGKRIALLCFSRGLSRYLKSVVETWPEGERPAFVGTFHQLGRSAWGVEAPAGAPVDWWESTSAELMLEHLRGNRKAVRFDGFVVDEAQDISDLWWSVIHEANTSSIDQPVLCVFGDVDQSLFARSGYEALSVLPPLTLTKNLRNTAPIAEVVGLLAPELPPHNGLEGPPVRFVECSASDAMGVADDQIDALLDAGWSPGDIALVTTNHRHEVQKERQAEGRDAYWDSYWDDSDIFYAHVTGFKGLERPVVVVAVDGWQDPDRAREYLYVALSRARDLLIVCGSAEDVEAAGGAAVLRALRG